MLLITTCEFTNAEMRDSQTSGIVQKFASLQGESRICSGGLFWKRPWHSI